MVEPANGTPHTKIIAHRGGAALWPENTMLAVIGASALGVDGVEIDVHLSQDDEVIVFHDSTLERSGLGIGPVREYTTSQLNERAELFAPDRRVPTLREVIGFLADKQVEISIELKVDAARRRYPGLAAAVIKLLDDGLARPLAFIHAFDWAFLEEVQHLAPDVALGANVDRKVLSRFSSWEVLLDELQQRAVRDLNADHRLVDEAIIASAHARGLMVTLWTVNEDDAIRRFLAAGVDHLCTDHPDRALALRDGR